MSNNSYESAIGDFYTNAVEKRMQIEDYELNNKKEIIIASSKLVKYILSKPIQLVFLVTIHKYIFLVTIHK